MSDTSEKLFEFGHFRLDIAGKLLFRGNESVPLPPKVLDILCMLVDRQGGVVSKTELLETVWADSFVEESNLTQSIYMLRRVLGKDDAEKEMIETVPRRGYRMAVPIVDAGSDPFSKLRRSSDQLSHSDEAQAPSGYKRFAVRFGIGLAAVIAISVLSGYIYSTRSSQSAPIEKVKFQKLTFSGDIEFPVISPDGQSFAYVKENAINLQDIATGSSIKLDIPGQKHFGNLQFSNEGESIFFRNEDSFDAEGDIFQVSRFGGPAKQIAQRVWSSVGFSPDNRTMAFVRFYPKEGEWAVILKNLSTGNEDKLISRNLPYTIYRSGYPVWSPDGSRIAIVEQTPDQTIASRILLVDVATGQAETLSTPRFTQIEQVGWMPDGKRLLITGRENNRFFQLWAMNLQNADLRPITNDLNIYRNLTVSANGKNLLARQYSLYSHIWTAAADELQNQKQITFGNLNRDGGSGITWTPDGGIVYASRITGNTDIWSVRPENGIRKQLTENAGTNNTNPFVSADGQSIFFESTRSGRRSIWRANSDGSNPTQITFSETETDFLPVVSTEGKTLYYIQRNPKSNVVWRQSLTEGKREMVTQQGKLSPGSFLVLSPDGGTLVFEDIKDDRKDNTSEIVFLDMITGGEPRSIIINSPDSTIVWSPDGRFFDYAENQSTVARFWRQSIDGAGKRKLLFELPKEHIYGFAWSRDGKTLALSRGRQQNDAILLKGFE
ncbi:hypothetical protein BH10ACI2_BH10ACI2_00730 [soil metagenome]